jgi:hypothetical protein
MPVEIACERVRSSASLTGRGKVALRMAFLNPKWTSFDIVKLTT